VMGRAEINALLNLEKMRDLAGCNEVSCIVEEIGGALDARYVILLSFGSLGKQQTLTVKAWDNKAGATVGRRVWMAPGNDPRTMLPSVPEMVRTVVEQLRTAWPTK